MVKGEAQRIEIDPSAERMLRDTGGITAPKHIAEAYASGIRFWTVPMDQAEFRAKMVEVINDPLPHEVEMFRQMNSAQRRAYAENYVRDYAASMGREIID